MLFNVEEDSGDRIVGYFVPDSYSDIPSIRVTSSGKALGTLQAGIVRSSLVSAGRHANGQCGFAFTGAEIPELPRHERIELYDAESGLMFYRRVPHALIVPRRVFRLEVASRRWSGLDAALCNQFQQQFVAIDRFGAETTNQVLVLNNFASCYVSARVHFRAHELSMDSDLARVCVLQDPIVELAETLLTLKLGELNENFDPGLREAMVMEEMIALLSEVDFGSERALRRTLSNLPDSVEMILSNPLARRLGALHDETLNTTHVGTAIEVLSSFSVVGLRAVPTSFLDPLTELCRVRPDTTSVLEAEPKTLELASLLRPVSAVIDLLEMDLEIYDRVRRAVEEAHDSKGHAHSTE